MKPSIRPIYLISKTPYEGVNHIPVLTTEFLKPKIDFLRYDAMIVTSKQALEALEFAGMEWRRLPLLCVGESTAKLARELGAEVLGTGTGYGDSLGRILIERYGMWRWLFVRPEVVASSFCAEARSAGVRVDEKIVYRTGCNPHIESINLAEDAILVFTSPSAIRCFAGHFRLKPGYTYVTIGKTTASALPAGLEVYIAEEPSVRSAIERAKALRVRE